MEYSEVFKKKRKIFINIEKYFLLWKKVMHEFKILKGHLFLRERERERAWGSMCNVIGTDYRYIPWHPSEPVLLDHINQ